MSTSKIVKCIDCGREFPRKELNRNFRCHDCAEKAMMDTRHQLWDKSGPYYEKWKAAMKGKGLARLRGYLDEPGPSSP